MKKSKQTRIQERYAQKPTQSNVMLQSDGLKRRNYLSSALGTSHRRTIKQNSSLTNYVVNFSKSITSLKSPTTIQGECCYHKKIKSNKQSIARLFNKPGYIFNLLRQLYDEHLSNYVQSILFIQYINIPLPTVRIFSNPARVWL
jgi:hypothetical protein